MVDLYWNSVVTCCDGVAVYGEARLSIALLCFVL